MKIRTLAMAGVAILALGAGAQAAPLKIGMTFQD